MSVIHNTQRPESALKKKSRSVAYHFCREEVAMAMDEYRYRTCHITTAKNQVTFAQSLFLVTSAEHWHWSRWFCMTFMIRGSLQHRDDWGIIVNADAEGTEKV